MVGNLHKIGSDRRPKLGVVHASTGAKVAADVSHAETRMLYGKRLSTSAILMAILYSSSAYAVCPTFSTLTNGTTADATKVMDNFNYILQCPNFSGNVGIGTTPTYSLDIV